MCPPGYERRRLRPARLGLVSVAAQLRGAAQLVFSRDNTPGSSGAVRIVPFDVSLLPEWTANTRLSTVFTLQGDTAACSPDEFTFSGEGWLVFLGPVNPAHVLDILEAEDCVWGTLGLLSVAVFTRSEERLQKLVVFANAQRLCCEHWRLRDGLLVALPVEAAPRGGLPFPEELLQLAEQGHDGELVDAIREFGGLWTTVLSRASGLPDEAHTELKGMSQNHAKVCLKWIELREHYDVLGEVITVNSALSRMCTQQLAGSSPVFRSECGIAVESLLGIGTAVLALQNVRRFLQGTFDDALLAQRLERLDQYRQDFALVNIDRAPALISDLLAVTPVASSLGDDDPDVAYITHFSGREGYRSTDTTISAPLASVSACNSLRWSLLTLTHEVLHGVVDEMQAVLMPLSGDVLDKVYAFSRFNAPESTLPQPDNLLDEMRKVMTISCCAMVGRALQVGGLYVPSSAADLREVIRDCRPEVNEILVHVLDYLYFYDRDAEFYVRSIWSSWGVLPDVSARLRNYLVRTVCAVFSNHLWRKADESGPDGITTSINIVRAALGKLAEDGIGGQCVLDAIAELETNAVAIKDDVLDRGHLILVARYFMWSDTLSTAFSYDRMQDSLKSRQRGGYLPKTRVLDFDDELENPLEFIERFSKDLVPDPVASAWVLYALAFGLSSPLIAGAGDGG